MEIQRTQTGRPAAWDRVQISRMTDRPVAQRLYPRALFTDFMEFHGDRYFGDDWRCHRRNCLLPRHAGDGDRPGKRDRNTKENIERNFGMPSPDGYRKALRLMKQAEKFGRPVICFVDTPGAFCGLEAEERGQGEAIARNHLRDVWAYRPGPVYRHRRRRKRRRSCHGDGRSGLDAGELHLFYSVYRKDLPVFCGRTAGRQRKRQK